MANVLIIGCGDLGSALAKLLSKHGHQVTGVKRHPPAQPGNINYIAADITVASELEVLAAEDFELVFFIVSADGRNEQSYRDIYDTGLNNLISLFARNKRNPRWLFVSSTSVYGQDNGEWVDETSLAQPTNSTSRWIIQAEQTLQRLSPKNIIVRFSGIYGPGREYLLKTAQQAPMIQRSPPYYTNRIHQDDCLGILAFLLQQHLADVALESCYLASDDNPAPMWEVISWLASEMHCPQPQAKQVLDNAPMNKRCSNQRLKALGYRFKYPSYSDGYLPLILNRNQPTDI